MIKPLYLTQYDLQPYYGVTAKDASGALVDLTGATIRATMVLAGGAAKFTRRAAGIVIANQTTNKGEFDLQWQAGDTDTPGTYYIEFEITPASGGKFTIPNAQDAEESPAKIIIKAGLDSE